MASTLFIAGLGFLLAAPAAHAQADLVLKGRQVWEKKRCAACHGIGQPHSGPDLAGLAERRARPWIYRWLKESEKMIREGDSTAVALFQEYNRLPMPNQKMSQGDVDALLAFISAEERRVNRNR